MSKREDNIPNVQKANFYQFKNALEWFEKYELKDCVNSAYFYQTSSHRRYLATLKLFSELAGEDKGRILELGAWPYHFTLILKKLNFPVTAIDFRVSEDYKWLQEKGLSAIECNIEKDRFPFEDNSCQFVFFCEVIEHLYHNPLHAFLEINRVLKKGGLLLISTPNRDSLRRRIYSFLLMYKDIYESPYELYRQVLLGGRPDHFRLYNRYEIEEFLTNTGFLVEKVVFSNFSEAVVDEKPKESIAKKVTRVIFKKRNYIKAFLDTSIQLLTNLNPAFQETILIGAKKNRNINLMDLK